MKYYLILLTVFLPSYAVATEGVEIVVFSKYLKLEGNCKYWPVSGVEPHFLCINNDSNYTVSFFDLGDDDLGQRESMISEETAKEWKINILSQNTEIIDGLTHKSLVFVTEDGSINSHQYQICDESLCMYLTAKALPAYSKVILQLSSRILGDE